MEASSRDRQSEGKRGTEITMFGCGGSEVDQREGTEQRTQVSPGSHPPRTPTTLDPNLANLQPNLVKILPWLMPSRERERGVREGEGE